MTTPDDTRTATAVLRAVADLIETHNDIPLPGISINFYVRGENVPATMAAIATALPCRWHADISRSGSYEWLNLRSDPPGGSTISDGVHVKISADAAATCTEAGAKTVTVWQPRQAITAVLDGRPVEGAQ